MGGTSDDLASCVQQTTDGGYIVVGYSNSVDGDVTGHHGILGSSDVWVVKLSSSGSLQWQKSLGGTAYDNAVCIQQTSDGGYVLAGTTTSNDGDVSGNHGQNDYWVVKLSATGSLDWQKCYGGSANELATAVQQTADGGYIVGGYTNSNDSEVTGNHYLFSSLLDDYWIVKLTSSGGMEWEKCLGGSGNDESYSTLQTSDGGYILAGSSASGAGTGDVTGNHGNADFWVVKLNNPSSVNGIIRDTKFTVYPNPANDVINIEGHNITEVKIFNTLGQIVYCVNFPPLYCSSGREIKPHLADGIYFLQTTNNIGFISIARVIVKQ